MASASRTLTLKLLADIDNFQKNLKNADNDVSGFSGGLQKFSKIAGAAFLAAGVAAAGYAAKLAIDGVKAAIEDEAAQAKLATTLKNVTGATDDQIKSLENYILKTSLAFNVTDDDLRPSLDRLVRSTKNVEEAQKLQTLALNIAAGTGKSLQTVSEALAKAHDGNFTALKKLGGGIDESIIKQKDFDAATAALALTFKDQASAQADTFQGKLGRLQIAFNEGKETIGSFILDAITPIVNIIVEKVVPAIQNFSDGIGGAKGLKGVMQAWIDFAKNLFTPIIEGIKNVFDKIKNTVMENKDEFQTLFNFLKNYVAPFIGGALKLAIEALGTALDVIIKAIAKVIDGFEKALAGFKAFKKFLTDNPISNFFSGASFVTAGYGGSTTSTGSSFSIPNSPAMVESFREGGGFQNNSSNNVNITVNGAIDPIGTARTINTILNNEGTLNGSFTRTGQSNVLGV